MRTDGEIPKAHRTSRGLSLAKMAQALAAQAVKRTRAMVYCYEAKGVQLKRPVVAAYIGALEREQSEVIELYEAAGFLVVSS